MQAINIWIVNPLFLAAFLGTGIVSALLALVAMLNLSQVWSLPLLASGLYYVVGSPLVTMIFDLPLNNRLAAAKPETAEAASLWTNYLRVWTAWNHLRSVLSLVATALFTLALSRS